MGLLDFLRPKKLEDHFLQYEGKVIHANGNIPTTDSSNDIHYLLRYQTQGNQIKVRYYQRCDHEGNPIPDAHYLRDIFSLSVDDYKKLAQQIKSGDFSTEEFDRMLRSHRDYQGNRGVLVKIFKKGSEIKVSPLVAFNVSATPIKRNGLS